MASYSQITNTEQKDNNKKSYKTMNTKNQNIGENYTSPLCTLLKVSNEGVLCTSFKIDPSVDKENEIDPYYSL